MGMAATDRVSCYISMSYVEPSIEFEAEGCKINLARMGGIMQIAQNADAVGTMEAC